MTNVVVERGEGICAMLFLGWCFFFGVGWGGGRGDEEEASFRHGAVSFTKKDLFNVESGFFFGFFCFFRYHFFPPFLLFMVGP